MDKTPLEFARLWIGTPYVLGQAVRGRGCDCVGLVRGVWAEYTGNDTPKVPGWRADWVNNRARPLVTAARQHLAPLATPGPQPGDVVVLRVRGSREAHCGILEEGDQLIHAMESVGVVCVPFAAYRSSVAFAASFPTP